MVVECICIILIIFLMGVVFLRAHRKDYAMTTLPLLILPLLHLLGLLLVHPITDVVSLDKNGVIIAFDALALVISCTALGFFSHQIKLRRARILYMLCCGTFVTILTWVFILNTLQ